MKRGFTLIEALIVITLIGILAAILVPQYKTSIVRAREAVLKENLFLMRDAINHFFADKKKYPTGLDDLVAFRYLREIPVDPITRGKNWIPEPAEPAEGEEYDPEVVQGIVGVKSAAQGTALDGTQYQDW